MDVYRESRMQATGVDSSTKLSPFLGLGCLSPRTVYRHVKTLQQQLSQQPPRPAAAVQHLTADDGAAGQGPTQRRSAKDDRSENFEWLIMHLGIR